MTTLFALCDWIHHAVQRFKRSITELMVLQLYNIVHELIIEVTEWNFDENVTEITMLRVDKDRVAEVTMCQF